MGFRKVQQRNGGALNHADKHMLLIEDSRVFSTIVTFELEASIGIAVTHCASLADLKRLVDKRDYSVAVLDLNLPDAPNCEALDFVIERGIPAIVFTGTFNDATRDHVLARGVVDCIIKNERNSVSAVVSSVERALTNSATTILVIDDQAQRRGETAALLRRQQFVTMEASTSAEALQASELHSVDLIVSEYGGTDVSAVGLVEDLSARFGDNAIPVVALASPDEKHLAARYLLSGGADFIPRPFAFDEFFARTARVVSVLRRVQALHLLAGRDYLTDLNNRRYFFQHGPRLVERSLRNKTGTSVAILDIDHFKRLNDTYGHEIGDLVLKAVARNIRQYVGNDHLLARLGGEEFGILFNALDLPAAEAFCEELRRSIADAKIMTDDEELSITVSIGVAPIEHSEMFDNYLNAADQFLYMAKHAGRNRIVSERTLSTVMSS